jgi:hypothetical protein
VINSDTITYHLGVADASLFICYHPYKEVMPVIESFETQGVAGGGAR